MDLRFHTDTDTQTHTHREGEGIQTTTHRKGGREKEKHTHKWGKVYKQQCVLLMNQWIQTISTGCPTAGQELLCCNFKTSGQPRAVESLVISSSSNNDFSPFRNQESFTGEKKYFSSYSQLHLLCIQKLQFVLKEHLRWVLELMVFLYTCRERISQKSSNKSWQKYRNANETYRIV